MNNVFLPVNLLHCVLQKKITFLVPVPSYIGYDTYLYYPILTIMTFCFYFIFTSLILTFALVFEIQSQNPDFWAAYNHNFLFIQNSALQDFVRATKHPRTCKQRLLLSCIHTYMYACICIGITLHYTILWCSFGTYIYVLAHTFTTLCIIPVYIDIHMYIFSDSSHGSWIDS